MIRIRARLRIVPLNRSGFPLLSSEDQRAAKRSAKKKAVFSKVATTMPKAL
jgi:hypothetical protein